MALSSSPTSPFPKTLVALTRPEHAAVRSNHYDNYNQAFSEDTSYNNSYTSSDSSTIRASAFGNKVLSVISENAKTPGLVATLSRKASLHVRAKSLANGRSLGDIFTPRRPEEDEEPEMIMPYKSTLTGGPGRQPEPELLAPPRPTGLRSFSWFGSKNAAPSPPPAPVDSSTNLDLFASSPTSLLFPQGSPDVNDPNAFTELVQNAEFLISRLQAAYKEQSSALNQARAEREAQAEEAEEAETRARHLKLQLDDLAAKSAEQAAANRALAEELAAEKQRRHEDREQFERVARQNDLTPRRSRLSGSSSMASDSGFESEADTASSASSCSRPITPTSPHPHNYALNDRWGSIMEPIKEVRPSSRDLQTARMPGRTCEVDTGVWVYMREEKTRLERRVQELEGAMDGVLDLIA